MQTVVNQAQANAAIERDADTYLAVHRALDESVSDALLTERELEVRDRTRQVVAAEVAPRAAEVDRTHEFAHEGYQALAKAGLGGLTFPERLGGTGDSHVAYAVAMEEITAGCAATSLIYMTQTHAAFPILYAGGESALAEKYIPGLLDGSAYGSMAITEPGAGSDVAGMTSRAVQVPGEDAYVLSGSKTFITTGDRADVVVCFVTTDPSRGRDGVSAFVLDKGMEGFTTGNPFQKMGMHGSSTAELFFSDVRIPAGQRLGAEGGGWGIVMASVGKSRISAAAQGIGIARNAYARTLMALRGIHGFRLPDDVAFALAEMRGEILQARLLLLTTAREIDAVDQPSTAHVGMMKQVCTDLGWKVSVAAMNLLGAYGDLADFGVERSLRDSKVTRIYDGTNDVQRLLIGRDTQRRFKEFA
jgi:alkylation response protein AidB-like acyl-CoA dehydrogenase